MTGNSAEVVVGLVVSSIVSIFVFLTFAMFFDIAHRTFPTPMDYQIWNSFVISWSIISTGETLVTILAIVLPILAIFGIARQ